ncbi:MAG: chalcone isomerase family protein [Burkholderiales bacterium]|jgi:hypothetical protein|nr:chalcone isomerase family protein [Burkholderiales bacterium]
MNKRVFLATAAGLWLAVATGAGAQVVEVEGVKFEPSIQVGGATLQLNGAGVRKRAIFKVYAAGLYVPQKSKSAADLLAQKGPRRVQIGMLRDVDADTFASSLNEGLRNNSTEAQIAAMKPQADALAAALKSHGEAKKGDAINFEFLPDAGTRVVVNGKPIGNPIPGEDFLTAVLRIWLGEKPADADLKKALLGG